MSDPPPAKQSKKSRLLRPFKGLFSSRSPSHQGAQSVTPDSVIASVSTLSANNATSVAQVNPQSPQGAQSATSDNTIASISASPTNSGTSALQLNPEFHQGAKSATSDSAISSTTASSTNSATSASKVNNPQGTEYMAILDLSSTPSGPLTFEHRMKDWGSTAYEGLKMAIQGIYDFSGSFPPLQSTAGALLTITKVVDVRGSILYM